MRKRLFFLSIISFLLFSPVISASASLPMQQSFAPLVKKTGPAVVNIYTKRVVQEYMRSISPFFNDPFFNQFFQPHFGGQARERIENSLGSGVIVDASGLIATNQHVIKGADEINVVMSDGREFLAEKILVDARTDLAILKIDLKGEKLPFLELADSDAVEVGDIVLAIGNPFGIGQTVTSGIVSGLARTAVGVTDYRFFIQTDAAINPGNSGGALIDVHGKLIGVNSTIFSKSGGSLGIGFAIPANMLRAVITASRHGNKMIRPWSGLKAQRITPDLLEGLGLRKIKGSLISAVHPDSPAKKAGILVGDVIFAINGQEVESSEALKFRLAMHQIGDVVELKVLRKGKPLILKMKTEAAPENPPRNETLIKGLNPFTGATIANISPALIEETGGLAREEGVVVLSIQGGGNQFSVRKGDIPITVNGVVIKTVKQLVNLLASTKTRRWDMKIQRGQQIMSMTISR